MAGAAYGRGERGTRYGTPPPAAGRGRGTRGKRWARRAGGGRVEKRWARRAGGGKGNSIRNVPTGGRARAGTCGKNGGRGRAGGDVWEKQRGARLTGGERGARIRHAPTGGRAQAGDVWEKRWPRPRGRGTCGKRWARRAGGACEKTARAGGHVKKQRGARLTGGGRGGRIRHAPTGGRAQAGDVWEKRWPRRAGGGRVEKRWPRRAGGGRVGSDGRAAQAGGVWKNGGRAAQAGGVWKNDRNAAYGRGKRSCTEVPRPGSLSRRRSAPCSAAPCLTMDSPSPVPPAPPSGRAWLLSTR